MRRIIGICGLVAVLAAGCGLFDSDDDASSDTTEATGGQRTSIIDEQIAEDSMLSIGDLGGEWTVITDTPGMAEGLVALSPGCGALHDAYETVAATRTASAGPFAADTAEGRRLRVQISIFEDEQAATDVMDAIVGADLPACFTAVAQNIPELVGQEVTSDETEMDLGDQAVAVTVEFPTATAPEIPTSFERVFIRDGRSIAELAFESMASDPLDPAEIIDTVSSRLTINLSAADGTS